MYPIPFLFQLLKMKCVWALAKEDGMRGGTLQARGSRRWPRRLRRCRFSAAWAQSTPCASCGRSLPALMSAPRAQMVGEVEGRARMCKTTHWNRKLGEGSLAEPRGTKVSVSWERPLEVKAWSGQVPGVPRGVTHVWNYLVGSRTPPIRLPVVIKQCLGPFLSRNLVVHCW